MQGNTIIIVLPLVFFKNKIFIQGGKQMLRMTVATEEYLMIGDDIKLVFLGGTGKHLRIMIDAPKEVGIVRSRVLEKNITDLDERAELPKYYKQEEHPEKYKKKKRVVMNDSLLMEKEIKI